MSEVTEEVQGTSAPEGVVEVTPPPEPSVEAATPPAAGGEAEVAAAPAFTPNWSYKFDKEERVIPEHWRAVAKDEKTYSELVEALQSREALPKHKQRAEEYEQRIAQYEPVVSTVNKLKELYAQGAHERVLEAIGYDADTLKNVVREIMKREQLPPEAQAAFNEKRRLELEKEKLESENMEYRSERERELVQQTDFQLDQELGKPEYSRLKEVFEASRGTGTFKQYVVSRGSHMVSSLGRHVTPTELLAEISKEFAPFMSVASASSQPAAKKVVPTVAGVGGSPAQKGYGSLEELKKRQQQLQGIED